jgi:hypothetical protein
MSLPWPNVPIATRCCAPGAIDTLTRKPAIAQAEPADRRMKLSLTAAQEVALKEKAGDVPLARWVVRCLEQQGLIPLVARGSSLADRRSPSIELQAIQFLV